jgi:hypothetical protein
MAMSTTVSQTAHELEQAMVMNEETVLPPHVSFLLLL